MKKLRSLIYELLHTQADGAIGSDNASSQYPVNSTSSSEISALEELSMANGSGVCIRR